MIVAFYQVLFSALFLINLPKMLWQRICNGKYKKSFSFKLGFKMPNLLHLKSPVIWIHAGSLGETKAAIAFTKKLKEMHPDHSIVFSSTTETGYDEVKRSLSFVDAQFFLPFDFSFLLNRYFTLLRPSLLVLVESDFWPNLLRLGKKFGAKTLLINGKISERSFKRHLLLKPFSKKLFSYIDLFCMQNDEYVEKFKKLSIKSEKLFSCGNLKFDTPKKETPENLLESFRKELGILPQHIVIAIGSTHTKEEEILLDALGLFLRKNRNVKILLAPRHPERFEEVENLLLKQNWNYVRYSKASSKNEAEKVILIDTMGILNTCYEIADVAIVGGSYVNIGGHNILEPLEYGIPVFFGPHMDGQKELTSLVKNAHIGFQKNPNDLLPAITSYLQDEKARHLQKKLCEEFFNKSRGGTLKCLEKASFLLKSK